MLEIAFPTSDLTLNLVAVITIFFWEQRVDSMLKINADVNSTAAKATKLVRYQFCILVMVFVAFNGYISNY